MGKTKKVALKSMEDEDKLEVVIPTVDDLLGVDPILDAEECIKPKEVKEKSSKQKTLKQGKKVKPSIVEAALISAGETALEPTPAAEEDDIIFSDDLQGGVDPILEAEEISKPKERKEKSSKLKAPKQVKKEVKEKSSKQKTL